MAATSQSRLELSDCYTGLPDEAPSSIRKVIVYMGTNDTILQWSGLTKSDFNHIFSFLMHCGKSVFISGPILTVGRGTGCFSRLHTWLQSACRVHNVACITMLKALLVSSYDSVRVLFVSFWTVNHNILDRLQNWLGISGLNPTQRTRTTLCL